MHVHPPGIHAHWSTQKGSLKSNGVRESAGGNESDQRRVLIFQSGTYLVETKTIASEWQRSDIIALKSVRVRFEGGECRKTV
jgi:hypothetical protein